MAAFVDMNPSVDVDCYGFDPGDSYWVLMREFSPAECGRSVPAPEELTTATTLFPA
jgi:hypothetical protein